MIKKITAIALFALLLTSCHTDERKHQVTGTAETTVTTPLTLTEITTTETSFEPTEEEKPLIELAVFNPFADSVVVEDELYRELSEAVERVSDWNAILHGNSTGFHACMTCQSRYTTSYFDGNADFSESVYMEERYCPINPEIAETEEQLFERVRSVFTENIYTDDELRKLLFEVDDYGSPPSYITVDDTLCVNCEYKGVMTNICFTNFNVTSYSESRVELSAAASDVAYPPSRAFMTLVKSEKYGWRLDSFELKPYNEYEAMILYNGLKLREERLNSILGGGEQPENPRTTVVDGESYTETNTGMSLAEMQEFFAEMFNKQIYPPEPRAIALCESYTQTYIADVYYELDGVLYRKDSAPKWYMPEIHIDPHTVSFHEHTVTPTDAYFKCDQNFYDKTTDTTFSAAVAMVYCSDLFENNCESCSYVNVASELPIKVLE